MAPVVVFPSVLGVGAGVESAASRLRAADHEVRVVDIFEGRRFDDYPPAMAFAWEELGPAEMLRRAVAGVQDIPEGSAVMGFSLGCMLAAYVATQVPVSAVVMIAGAIPVSGFGQTWPAGVPAQTHSMLEDPWRKQAEVDETVREVQATARIEVFDYPGAGHLFTDPSLPAEFDPTATELLWQRVLPFLSGA